MIEVTTPAFRKQKLLQIATGVFAFAPTACFLVHERFACLAGAAFNTAHLRNRGFVSGDSWTQNEVVRQCDAHALGCLPMLWSLVYVAIGKPLTFRKSQSNISRLATMQVPLFEAVEVSLYSMLIAYGVVMFSFRNNDSFISHSAYTMSWYVFVGALFLNLLFSYLRDRSQFKNGDVPAKLLTSEEAASTRKKTLSHPQKLSKLGASKRTIDRSRGKVKLDGRNVVRKASASDGDEKPRSPPGEGEAAFEISPGLM